MAVDLINFKNLELLPKNKNNKLFIILKFMYFFYSFFN